MSISVQEEQINVTLPSESVRMIWVQPYLEFRRPVQEPFPFTETCNQRLLNAIPTVLGVAAEPHAHFVLSPEFALPGVDAVESVVERLAEAPSPTVVIAGVRGLSKADYTRLCALPSVSQVDAANAPDRVNDTQWVNTSVTFIKDDAGRLSLWIQPKISPSWVEANVRHQAMFPGGVVRIFRAQFDNGVPCRFFSVLCFDWVGREDGSPIPDLILEGLNTIYQRSGSPQDLQWAFILQHNDSPNHTSFLSSTNAFLNQMAHPFVRRQDAAVVMVSTASARKPSRGGQYGCSSIIFGPRAPFDNKVCQPTFATQSSRLRASEALGTCKDAIFREMGECIHRAEVRIPNFVVADVTDRTAALVEAEALPMWGASTDPRIPGGPVPAVTKWTNDELDVVPDLNLVTFTDNTVQTQLRNSHTRMVSSYRTLSSQDLAIRISGACAAHAGSDGKVDPAIELDSKWGDKERFGLHHIIQTLTLIDGAANLDAVGSKLHARYDAGGVEIAAICGSTHAECQKAFGRLVDLTYSPILFVSRDENNAAYLPRELENFADPRKGAGVKLADSQMLLDAARTKQHAAYQQFITELLNVADRSII
jgi:hypothetical protein